MNTPSPLYRGRGGGIALTFLAMLLVVVDFLAGVWANLYDEVLPGSLRAVFENPYVTTDKALLLHVVTGVLLGVVAFALLVWSLVRHRPRIFVSATAGLLGVLLAAGGGYQFLATGDPIYSFLMALGFLLALAAYIRAAHVLTRLPRSGAGGWMPGPPTPAEPASPPEHISP